jgi:hypothetical protein
MFHVTEVRHAYKVSVGQPERGFENRVLRRISGPKRGEVAGE